MSEAAEAAEVRPKTTSDYDVGPRKKSWTRMPTSPAPSPPRASQRSRSWCTDAKRFRNAHAVGAYLGLVPGENTTGGKRRLGSITKQGNTYARAMLVQAAWQILRAADRDDPLRVWAAQIAKKRGKKIAAIALARKLAGLLWAHARRKTSRRSAV